LTLNALHVLSAPPTPTTASPSELRGQTLFGTKTDPGIGCVLCHTGSLTTGSSRFTGMLNLEIHPYTDFAIHHMGAGLADSVTQGVAEGDQFRTAPLWGVGKRIFFLHDGRATPGAVSSRRSWRMRARARRPNATIRRFATLPAADQQALLDFLRSL
jgi:CxxC motif-containing protein (DUF1111 family)